MAKSWVHPAVIEFDWDRHNDLKYLDWFFGKWGYTPFPAPDPDNSSIPALPVSNPQLGNLMAALMGQGCGTAGLEQYAHQRFQSFEDGWK